MIFIFMGLKMKKGLVYKIIISLLITAVGATGAFAQSLSASDAAALLKKTDASTAFTGTDFTANYSLVQEKPGQGKSVNTAIMYRRDDASSYTILITGPESDRGKGYVQFDQNIWFYDPADKQFVFSSSKEKLQGTNATTADFTPQHYSDKYKINSATKEKLGSLDCVVFDLTAKVDDVNYPSVKLWVTADDGLIRKKEDYSLSGQLLRTTAIPSYQKYTGHSVPDRMLIVDNLRGKKISGKMQYEQTQITISNVSFAKQNNTVYTKKYVEMMSSK